MFYYFTNVIVIIFLGYAIVFPFFFWITPLSKIENGFYRFNLGKCCIVASLGLISYYLISPALDSLLLFWFSMLMLFTAIHWKAIKINNAILSFISLFGCFAFKNSLVHIAPDISSWGGLLSILLGSGINAGVFFSMILGHWYLNVVTLPIRLLNNSVLILSIIIFLRIIWNIFYFSTTKLTDSFGLEQNIWSFMLSFEGFLLMVAFFMGNLFPTLLNYFTWKTLKLQATQSATGLLYVTIISILFGDIIFKYYLLQYGLLI